MLRLVKDLLRLVKDLLPCMVMQEYGLLSLLDGWVTTSYAKPFAEAVWQLCAGAYRHGLEGGERLEMKLGDKVRGEGARGARAAKTSIFAQHFSAVAIMLLKTKVLTSHRT